MIREGINERPTFNCASTVQIRKVKRHPKPRHRWPVTPSRKSPDLVRFLWVLIIKICFCQLFYIKRRTRVDEMRQEVAMMSLTTLTWTRHGADTVYTRSNFVTTHVFQLHNMSCWSLRALGVFSALGICLLIMGSVVRLSFSANLSRLSLNAEVSFPISITFYFTYVYLLDLSVIGKYILSRLSLNAETYLL
jgi:hypothetical protein